MTTFQNGVKIKSYFEITAEVKSLNKLCSVKIIEMLSLYNVQNELLLRCCMKRFVRYFPLYSEALSYFIFCRKE